MPSGAALTPASSALKRFTRDAYGNLSSTPVSVTDHLLRGSWQATTLRHYESAVRKLLTFASLERISRSRLLPISKPVLARFIVWCSFKSDGPDPHNSSIAASTIRCYLAGIRAWHAFNGVDFPADAENITNLLLRSTKRLEARYVEPTPTRAPVMVADLAALVAYGDFTSMLGNAALTAALSAFWGVARLGEIIPDIQYKRPPVWDNLAWSADRSFVKLAVLEAKTATPGEVQHIHLQRQMGFLDPVSALERWCRLSGPDRNDPVFSWLEGNARRTLRKGEMLGWCRSAWSAAGKTSAAQAALGGHSFRIGGTSLHWNLGASKERLKGMGRWKSDAYKLYLRKYSDGDLLATKRILKL